MAGLRRFSTKDLVYFYGFILQIPEALNVVLGIGIVFCCLGAILFFIAMRITRAQKTILIREGTQLLRIPVGVVKDFIDQILGQHPCIKDFQTSINNRRKQIYIDISAVFDDSDSICEGINQVRQVLKEELKHYL